LVTEKVTIKKENDRVTNEKNNLLKELKVQRVSYNLVMDEVAQANKQNNEYRGLILQNEAERGTLSDTISSL
jgi:DNA gyrase/topoisomerase IV subunit A